MDRPTCRTCPYYACDDCNSGPDDAPCCRDEDGHLAHGPMVCRRYPPSAGEFHDGMFLGTWCEVEADDFCGEHPDFPAWLKSRQSST